MKVPKSPYLEGFILKILISEQFLRMNISIGCACRIEPKDFFALKKIHILPDTNNPKYFPQGFAGGPNIWQCLYGKLEK